MMRKGIIQLEYNRKIRLSEYHYDERMLCTKIIYPDLTETREEYNDKYQLISQTDEEGRFTLYQYNGWSQIQRLRGQMRVKYVFLMMKQGGLWR